MGISKIKVQNFKRLRCFECKFEKGINTIVGDNEAGKSTILEAIHLALTGMYCGRGIRNEISPYLFNNDAVNEYLNSLKSGSPIEPPAISIEVFFDGSIDPNFEGNGNSDGADKIEGFIFKIAFSDQYQPEYETLIKSETVSSLPTEYYVPTWTSFSRNGGITTKTIPIKSLLVDSSNYRYQNGSDVYISRIVKNLLDSDDIISISQAHRKMIEGFASDETIKSINEKISAESTIIKEKVSLSADLGTKNAWENSLVTQVAGVPFAYIGKGAQCIVKTELALNHKRAQNAEIILLEEPESHLSFSRLSELICMIGTKYGDRQIIISTHSSFVANKLGLANLCVLKESNILRLTDIPSSDFFRKMPGYDTLRLILCKKAILVEGPSDELIVQRAYMDHHSGRLPIDDGIDVISVGLSFLRFLEIAYRLNVITYVVTDTDGDVAALEKKYADYLGEKASPNITLCYDTCIDGLDKPDHKEYNYNTLEPKLLKMNNLALFNEIFGTSFTDESKLRYYMRTHKTECALAIFDSDKKITYPQYILKAVCYE